FAPGQRVGTGDPVVDLQDAAFEDAVLGPASGKVLHTSHLNPRDGASRGKASDPIPVGGPGEVADEGRAASHDVDQLLRVVGIDTEVGGRPSSRGRVPAVVVAEDQDGPIRSGPELV